MELAWVIAALVAGAFLWRMLEELQTISRRLSAMQDQLQDLRAAAAGLAELEGDVRKIRGALDSIEASVYVAPSPRFPLV
jgi:hypothetical protein